MLPAVINRSQLRAAFWRAIEGISADQIGYSRGIRPVGKDFVTSHYKAYGGRKPPNIDHQGIDDAFIEKGSVTHYFYNGNWLKLTGAD